jgi:hypothetical protein
MLPYELNKVCKIANKKAPAFADAFLVEQVQNFWPQIVEELRRWKDILAVS